MFENTPVVVLAHSPHPSAEAAFEAAVQQCAWRGARLVIINATTGEALVDSHLARDGELHQMVRRAEEAGIPVDVDHLMDADVARAIVDRSADLGAELVVLATRRRSSLGKFIMGSVAQQVLMEASAEVLLVKGPAR